MNRYLADVAERFAFDVLNHQMTVLHDDGVYRHLRFRQPETSTHWFDLVTWPGCLAINGDMKTYLFARETDMFEFFRGEHVNPSYWSEKLRASSNVRGYDEYKARDRLASEVAEHEAEWPGLGAAVDHEILDTWSGCNVADEHDFRLAVRDFEYRPDPDDRERVFQFADTWEWDLAEWSYHLLWCLHAIRWGIDQYDKARSAVAS